MFSPSVTVTTVVKLDLDSKEMLLNPTFNTLGFPVLVFQMWDK